MPRTSEHTDAQRLFLRSLRKQSDGLSSVKWPSAVVLRRWLRRPGFRAALQSIAEALAVQTDMQLSLAAAEASLKVRDIVRPGDNGRDEQTAPPASRDGDLARLMAVIRQAHLRQRQVAVAPPAEPVEPEPIPTTTLAEAAAKFEPRRYDVILRLLRDFKPDRPISQAIECIEAWVCGRKPASRDMFIRG